jgi:predicted transcriptional regulator
MAGFAFFILARSLVATHGRDSALAKAIGRDIKGKASLVVYLVAVPLAFVSSIAAFVLYVAVAAVWFVPDRRIERAVVP